MHACSFLKQEYIGKKTRIYRKKIYRKNGVGIYFGGYKQLSIIIIEHMITIGRRKKFAWFS